MKRVRKSKRMSRKMSTFNLGILFGTETSPTYSQETTPVESWDETTFTEVTASIEKSPPPRKTVKIHKRLTSRMSTFNFGLLFGTENSPTYSQQETPVESYEVSTFVTMTATRSGSQNEAENSSKEGDDRTISSGSGLGSEIATSSGSEIDDDDPRLDEFRNMFKRKPPTPKTPETDVMANMKISKLIRDWNKNARMIGFVRQEPVPQPPYSACYGINPRTPARTRKLSNFVPNVDTTSIYDMQDQKTPHRTPGAVLHRLQHQPTRPDDFISPDQLPEALYRNKV